METCNVVRMRVKPEFEAEFLARNDNPSHGVEQGLIHSFLVRTGERTYCFVGQWSSPDALAAGQGIIAAQWASMRHMLEELEDNKGVADHLSGEIVAKRKWTIPEGDYWSG